MNYSKCPAPTGINVPDLYSENTFTFKVQPHCTKCGAVITGTVGKRILGTDFHCLIGKDLKPGKVFCYSCGQAASLCQEVIFCPEEGRLIPKIHADVKKVPYVKSYWIGIIAMEASNLTCTNHPTVKAKIKSGEAQGYILVQALEDSIITLEEFMESWPHCEDLLLERLYEYELIPEEVKQQILQRLEQEMTTEALHRT